MPRAQSADGAIHDFPDGTSPAVIDRVMKDYATQGAPQHPSNETRGAVQASPAQASGEPPSPLLSYLRESLGALGGAGPEIVRGAKDIGQTMLGVGERAELAEQTAGGAPGGAPGRAPAIPVGPGAERLGDILQFLSGGLQSPVGAEARAAGGGAAKAGEAVAGIGEARALAREMGAPAKLERLERQAERQTARPPPFSAAALMSNPAALLGLIESGTHLDWKGLAFSLGSKTVEHIARWARDPNRRAEDLRKFLDTRRQARVADMQKFVDEHGGAGLDELKRMVEEQRQSAAAPPFPPVATP
jgi:hypothetical protein